MKKNRAFTALLFCAILVSSGFAQTAKVLINQVGYDPAGPKRAVIEGKPGDAFDAFKVKEFETGKEVFSGRPQVRRPGPKVEGLDLLDDRFHAGPAGRDLCHRVLLRQGDHPLLSVPRPEKRPGAKYALRCHLLFQGPAVAPGLWDKADRKMRFEGKEGTIDAHGGWFDATGDYGKHLSHLSFSTYFNPQQISLTAWSLFKSYRELDRRNDPILQAVQKEASG